MEDYHVSSLHVDGIVFTAAILNFCVKRKKVFISETEQDRAILTKLLSHRGSAESSRHNCCLLPVSSRPWPLL